MKNLRYILPFFFLFILGIDVYAMEGDETSILLITSYNPETNMMSINISDLLQEYELLGGTGNFIIESMNCGSLPDALHWRGRMKNILDKYTDDHSPQKIVLLGQEAWASYLSQEDERLFSIPMFVGLASRNVIILPDSIVSLPDWEPESIDVLADDDYLKKYYYTAGFLYEYDIEQNINLILQFLPQTENIALLTDNTYGGVAIRAHVRKQMEKFPHLNFIGLDGRTNSIYTMKQELANLPKNSVILIGTWRVDSNEGFFLQNATYILKSANPEITAFTLSSLGLGHWAVGGYFPKYRNIGKEIAHRIIDYDNELIDPDIGIDMISNEYVFDKTLLDELGYSVKILPLDSRIENRDPKFFEKYKLEISIIFTIFVILVAAFFIAILFLVRAKRLNADLEISQSELKIAKDKAEEANKLKSAFLANMSHEIRTPLNAIVGFTSILTIGDLDAKDSGVYKEIIQNNAEMLLDLINNILDLSRLETDKISFYINDCDIVNLCQSTLSTIIYAKKNNVKVVYKPSVSEYIIKTDATRLKQILLNLLANAVKFTKNGTVTLAFEIRHDLEQVWFSVTDTGCGIAVEKHQIIFERFEKLNEHEQGTGLGLPICKLTINKLGGDIWIDPDYTNGAKFVVAHPLNLDKNMFSKPV